MNDTLGESSKEKTYGNLTNKVKLIPKKASKKIKKGEISTILEEMRTTKPDQLSPLNDFINQSQSALQRSKISPTRMSKLMSSPKRLKKDLGMLNLTINNSSCSVNHDSKSKSPTSPSPDVNSLLHLSLKPTMISQTNSSCHHFG
jgi:hypothetical protein